MAVRSAAARTAGPGRLRGAERPAILVLLGLGAFAGYVRALTWPMPSCSERATAEACAAAWASYRDALPALDRFGSEPLAWPLAYLLVAGLLVLLWVRRDRRRGLINTRSIGPSDYLALVVMAIVVASVTLVALGGPNPDAVYLPRGPIHAP